MFKNVQIDAFRRFADLLVAGSTVSAAADVAELPVKSFGNQRNCYVYALAHPVTGRAFYIGKGTGDRALRHGSPSSGNSLKLAIIGELRAHGLKPVIHILADELTSDHAHRIERTIIVRAHTVLANISHGQMPALDRVRAEARHDLGQIKPLCHLLSERPSRLRLQVWQRVVGSLARMAAG